MSEVIKYSMDRREVVTSRVVRRGAGAPASGPCRRYARLVSSVPQIEWRGEGSGFALGYLGKVKIATLRHWPSMQGSSSWDWTLLINDSEGSCLTEKNARAAVRRALMRWMKNTGMLR